MRIYSRKAKYLLDDCTDALLKIKMAFRAGAVDMTSDQLTVSANTITLPSAQTDINVMLPDAGFENWDAELRRATGADRTPSRNRGRSSSSTPGPSGGRSHLARQSDITLPQTRYDTYDDSQSMDLLSSGMGIASGEFDPDGGGLDLGLNLFGDDNMFGETSGAGAGAGEEQRRDAEGRPVDADGNVIEGDDTSSIGVGRDAPSEAGAPSIGSMLGPVDVSMDIGADMFDFGAGGDMDMDAAPPLDISNAGDVTAASQSLLLDDMTPRTKQQVADAAAKRAADASAKAAKERKQLVDRVTELDDSQQGGAANALGKRNVDDITMEEQYLPRSRAYAALLDIHNDPAFHFGTLAAKDGRSNLFAASDLDLAPELSNLFVIDLDAHRAAKRARTRLQREQQAAEGGEDELSMGVGRRAAPGDDDLPLDLDFGADDTLGLGGDGGDGLDMFAPPPLELDEGGDEVRKSDRIKEREAAAAAAEGGAGDETQLNVLPPLSRLSTPDLPGEGDEAGGLDAESFTPSSSRLLAAFEAHPSDVDQAAAAEHAALIAAEDAHASSAATAQGWSKNTVRAQRVIRHELSREDPDSELSMDKVGANASRRAAAGFFFELLVLGTKDQIALRQDEPYGDILVKGKDALWA